MQKQIQAPIRVLTLDWGDTLVANYGMPYGFVHDRALARLAAALNQAGGKADEAWMADCAGQLWKHWSSSADPDQNPEQKEFDYDALLSSWLAAAGLGRDQQGMEEALQEYGAMVTETLAPFSGVRSMLEEVHAMGIRIGILSHVPWPAWACRAWFERHAWDDFIDFYSLSSAVGFIKPHPAHYQDALDQAGCAPEEILHVGDHPLRDVEGAHNFGFQTVLKVTQGIYPDAQLISCPALAHIAHVQELPGLLHRGCFVAPG